MMEFRSDQVHVQVHAPPNAAATEMLTPDVLRLLGTLHVKFNARRLELLAERKKKAALYDAGDVPHFLHSSFDASSSNNNNPAVADPTWRCAAVPHDVQDRRVEITGPVDRKMVINGLNSGACVYMADFEDSTSPTWQNVVEGQLNLRDAVRGSITYTNPGSPPPGRPG